MIPVKKSIEAKTVEQLKTETEHHIIDVTNGLNFIGDLIKSKGASHDHTKIEMMDEFFAALSSGHIKDTEWYQKHITQERHHLLSYVHDDITLVDVIEFIVDFVMAGMTRSGDVYDFNLPPEVFQLAIDNTVKLLKSEINVVTPSKSLMDEPAD